MIAARIDEDPDAEEDAFDALIADLTALGHTAGDLIDGITTLAHPDGHGILATFDAVRHIEARLRHRTDGGPTWTIRLAADVPVAVARVVLHAMLHADAGGGESSILRAATAFLDQSRPLG
ncbi:hypothetical protein AB0H83_34960 [Dactylosporangium sp. NPDC050688]|uniref:hypothetical protein n=1 Tax=Dactylosporangium sp. NPDC050688 TaxID=3157217 RepID=UPI00340AE8E5